MINPFTGDRDQQTGILCELCRVRPKTSNRVNISQEEDTFEEVRLGPEQFFSRQQKESKNAAKINRAAISTKEKDPINGMLDEKN